MSCSIYYDRAFVRFDDQFIRYVGRYEDRLKPFAIFKPELVKAPQNRGATA